MSENERTAAITALAFRGEQIKQASAEYLWICCGVKPPLLPDRPVASIPVSTPKTYTCAD